MKQYISLLLLFCVTMLSSCEVVGGIFKAGMWTSIIIIVAIVALVLFIISKVRRK